MHSHIDMCLMPFSHPFIIYANAVNVIYELGAGDGEGLEVLYMGLQ